MDLNNNTPTNEVDQNEFYKKFAKEIVSNVLENIMIKIKSKIEEVGDQHENLNIKLDDLNSTVEEQMKVLKTIKKQQEYCGKLVDLKKEIAYLNSKFNHLKKRALKLQDQCEDRAVMLEQEKQKQLDDEEKLAPIVAVPLSSDRPHKKSKSKTKKSTNAPNDLVEPPEQTVEKNETAQPNEASKNELSDTTKSE